MNAAGSRARYRWVLEKRCFLLFLALLALLLAIPFLKDTVHGRALIGVFNALVLGAGVAAVERSKLSLVGAGLLGAPALAFQMLALQSQSPGDFAWSWGFAALFYTYTAAHLLQYVLRRDAMSADKLYGAVAAYFMIGITWALVFGVLQHLVAGSYALHGRPTHLDMPELIFFSFTVLTTAGFGDITPALIQSRFLTILEAVTGVMYVAILIARLTGVYPIVDPRR